MDAKIRKVVSQLKKASQAHAKQAAMLEKMIKSNGKTKKVQSERHYPVL